MCRNSSIATTVNEPSSLVQFKRWTEMRGRSMRTIFQEFHFSAAPGGGGGAGLNHQQRATGKRGALAGAGLSMQIDRRGRGRRHDAQTQRYAI